ncbi:MAG: UvrD-helicase domain-containing protein [Aestuariivita sp.]|nr:UvrD-helicase domain-containing protein [Aestuariivita sp.]MCY4347604.1 UvrD-helicase domain-containing protein [Aestuariivita sp.]
MMTDAEHDDNSYDDAADETIRACLSLNSPQSFFLYAGAGSGKTKSLTDALENILNTVGPELVRHGRQVGVITFTNAARGEILKRVSNSPIFHVATIHSFAWTLIEGRTDDIRSWLAVKIPDEIVEKRGKLSRARKENTRARYQREIASLEGRMAALKTITAFTYNPNGDNFGKAALSHQEVISICSDLLTTKETLQKIILAHYPFLLIDESQDTITDFIDALLSFEEAYKGRFALGLFGDTMQRIYSIGKIGLDKVIPDRWEKPEKLMNHRSRTRIIELANKIRLKVDGWTQRPRQDKPGGHVFAYILPTDTADKSEAEHKICADVAVRTGDEGWREPEAVKTLTVERHMASERLGFAKLFAAIDPVSELKTGFKDGTLAPLRLFTERIWPLVAAQQNEDQFEAMRILKAHSPMLNQEKLKASSSESEAVMEAIRESVAALMTNFAGGRDPTCGELLMSITKTSLFAVPDALAEALELDPLAEGEAKEDTFMKAWCQFLNVRFSEIQIYRQYAADKSRFGTHQGVKGLEFPRVMVIADDGDQRFKGLAAYEKLFGAKPATKKDRENQADGEETSFDRTRRLLYVTCTRAEECLVLVIYSDAPNAIKKTFLNEGWFSADEIIKFPL